MSAIAQEVDTLHGERHVPFVPSNGHMHLTEDQEAGAAIPPRAGLLGKTSNESRSTQGSFFFHPPYCRRRKIDPT
jgi:hypothetical protein